MEPQEREKIQVTIDEAKEAIELKEAALTLINSKSFKKIIEKQYYERESIRLVGLMSDPNMNERHLENIKKMMFGIGSIKMFINNIIHIGLQMELELDEADKELNRLEVI